VRQFVESLSDARRLALSTRGILGLWLPPALPNKDGWIQWVLGGPASLPPDAAWYIDGSCFDNALPGLSAAGFAAVATDGNGAVVAIVYGRPPVFVRNAPGAEAWALHIVLANSVNTPRITTDCLGLVKQFDRGLGDAIAAHKPLARIWNLIASSLDFTVPEEWVNKEFLWMPSHTSRSAVGVTLRSDGNPVTYLDWRLNRLVDKVAKVAAASGRAPWRQRKLVEEAHRAVEFSAALLGLTTRAANNFQTTEWRADGTAHTQLRRDSQPPAFYAKGRGARPRAAGPRPKPLPPPSPRTREREQRNADHAHLEEQRREQLEHLKGAKTRARLAAAELDDAREARALATWHQDRAAAQAATRPPERPSAAERLEALRQRVLARQADT